MKMNVKETAYMRGEETVAMNCYTNLTISKKVEFINTVLGFVVRDDAYYAVLYRLAFDYAVIDVFTDVDMDGFNNVDEIEDFIAETNIVDIVNTYADDGLIDELRAAVDQNIEYRTGIHENKIEKAIFELVTALKEKIVDVDSEKTMQMAEVISQMNGELTAEKLMEAYANSDLFQQRYREIVEQKNTRKKSTRSKKSNELKVVK